MNRMQIVGRLTADPELRATNSGIQLCTFTVAVNRRSNREEADFFPVTVWREAAVNCNKYLVKGSQVGVCGSIQLRRYEDKEGIKRTAIDLQADEVEFLSSKNDIGVNPSANNSANTTSKNVASPAPERKVSELEEVDDGDMPF